MAYLHCHDCDWSQDDFYSLKYNPITKILTDIKWLIKPEFIKFDRYFLNDLQKYIKFIPIIITKNNEIFSWNLLIFEFFKDTKIAIKQKFWTYQSFKNSKNKICPKCKSKRLDID